jgi:hypothetical protein
VDRGVFDLLTADREMRACIRRSCDARRQAQLDRAREVTSDGERALVLRDLPACDR